MELRYRLILMTVFLALLYFLCSLIVLLGLYFKGTNISQSEILSSQLYTETSLNSIRFARYYYGRSIRPDINSLYGISNLVNSINNFQQLNEKELDHVFWHFQPATSLQQLKEQYSNQFSTLKLYSSLTRVIKIYIENEIFEEFHLLCQNGLGITFLSKNQSIANEWYQQSIKNCQTPDNCEYFLSQFSSQIVFPKIENNSEIWRLNVGDQDHFCNIQIHTKINIPLITNSNQPIIYSLLANGQLNEISNGKLINGNLESALSLWPNQTEDFQNQLYSLISVPIQQREWNMIYDGMGEQRIVFFQSYYFTHPNYPSIDLTQQLLKNCSVVFLYSMSLTEYSKLAGENNLAQSTLINEIVIGCAIHIALLLYFWRKGVILALSLEMPINQLIKLTDVDMKYLEIQDFNLQSYSNLFYNEEIRQSYEVIINLLNSIKYSNNKLLQESQEINEAEALIILSMSKSFYKKYNNNPAVGICANNIARIHMKNQRYLEAMNEQEESVLIANQDLQSLIEMQKYANQAAQTHDDQQLMKLYLRLKNNVLQKFQRQDDQVMKSVIKDIEKKTKVIQNAQTNLSRGQTIQKSRNFIDTSQMKSQQEFENRGLRQTINQIKNITQEDQQIKYQNSELLEPIDSPRRSSPRKSSPISKAYLDEEFLQKKQILEYKIAFRKYQLACILFNYSMSKTQSTFLNESVKQFNDVMDDIQNLPDSFSIQYMKINIYIKKAFCFVKAKIMEKAYQELKEAQNKFAILKSIKEDIKQLDSKEFVDIFRNIPLEILQEKIYGLEALILMINEDYFQASQKFVSILKADGFYDPGLQKLVLKSLIKIFKKCQIDIDCLIKFSQQNQPKKLEFIFLIDYSSEMTNEQITLSHSMCKYVIQKLDEDAEVALYAFNESLHEIFSLQVKGTYKKLLESIIDKTLIKPGGQANIFLVLEIVIAILFEKDKLEQRKQLALHLKSNKIKQQIEQEEFKFSDVEFRGFSNSSRNGKTFSQGFSQIIKEGDELSENNSLHENMNQYKIDIDMINEEKDDQVLRYVCVFSEGVRNYNQMSINRLQSLIKKKNIHLLIFNIANQNMNMLYLKQLANVSEESKFFTNERDIETFFQQLKRNDFNKRVYLEFF
ncbi:unnamed protein product [Paramecium octaurelia]|uniref:VWFA domain-containing protein n=1 Tax=Paramecium octaurelia TaxID=43137 RepID=A0A8S1X5F9_PAROT|nr:unnamed protein product [Paramecium octaurelia]